MATGTAVVGIGVEIDAHAIAVGLARRARTGSPRTDLVSTTCVAARAAIVGVGLLVDAHATATALPIGTIAMGTTGAGAAATRFTRGTDVSTLSTVVGIGLGIGTGIITAVGIGARTAGTVTLLARGTDADAILTRLIRATSMPAGAAVGVIGVGVDTGAVTLGLSGWTDTLST